jgi:hypothetical protein
MLAKKTIYVAVAFTTLGCILGNYLYQLFTKRDWVSATERSWFQVATAIAICVVISTY